jgi:hypothetical protein
MQKIASAKIENICNTPSLIHLQINLNLNSADMKKRPLLLITLLLTLLLSGCLARSYSPVGVNCIPGTPFQDMPVACIGL